MINQQIELDNVEMFYDEYGSQYSSSRKNEGLLFNDFIERPALRGLIQDAEYLRKKPISKVLDIGCGPGIYACDLSGSGKKVVALDISQKMLSSAQSLCRETLSKERFETIEFEHSSFESFQSKEQYDLILATFMLSYFHNLDTFFKKARESMDPQGKLITSMLHPIRTFSDQKTIKNEYTVKNYFSNGFYNSDFINKNKILHLKKWNIEDIATAAFNSGLLIEKILEPRLSISPPPSCSKVRASFFEENPSIIMFMMRRK